MNQTEQTSTVVTKTDKKLLAAQNLTKASCHLKNTTSELKACDLVLEDRNASQLKWDDIARNITKVILPVVAKVADFLKDMEKSIAPIGYS